MSFGQISYFPSAEETRGKPKIVSQVGADNIVSEHSSRNLTNKVYLLLEAESNTFLLTLIFVAFIILLVTAIARSQYKHRVATNKRERV